MGSEVKSLASRPLSLEEAYARVKEDEVWLIGCDIPEYLEANRFNHPPASPQIADAPPRGEEISPTGPLKKGSRWSR